MDVSVRPTRYRKVYAQISQNARILIYRLWSRPHVARALASPITLVSMLRAVIEPLLRKEGVKRGLLHGLGSFFILGVLILLLVHPSTFSPAQTILVSILMLMSVTALLVMDLFD
jgi:predicted membrane channel-forming protein YqfA (hemolysin III family)